MKNRSIAVIVVLALGAAVTPSEAPVGVDGCVTLQFDFGPSEVCEVVDTDTPDTAPACVNFHFDFGPALANDVHGAAAAKAQQSNPIKFGGYLDGYFQFDFGVPESGDFMNGRGLDIAHDRLTLSFAQVEASMAPQPFGFNLQLFAGRGPELIHLAEPGGRDHSRWVRQAYITYASPGKNALTFDLGKFDTWIGYEGIDNRLQDQYSRSFNWTYSEPVYHTGLRINAKLTGKLSGALYLVRGWNEVEDSNDSLSIGSTLSYATDSKTTLTLQKYYGKEGSTTPNDVGSFGGIAFATAGESQVLLLDFIAAQQLTPDTKIGLNVDWASSKDAPNKGNWNGQGFYVKHQLNPEQALAFRLDRMEDTDGLRSGTPILFHSLTGTADWAIADSWTLRLELRKDFASKAFFNSDSGLTKDRTSITVAAIVRF
jgi:hypothetical protein